MFDIDLFYAKINGLKKKNRHILTNNFLSRNELFEISQDVNSLILMQESLVAVLVKERTFYRLYFHSNDLGNIQEIKVVLDCTNLPIILELVGKMEQLDLQEEYFNKVCFRRYSILSRWRTNKIDISYNAKDTLKRFQFSVAKMNNVLAIEQCFSIELDHWISHLPNTKKLEYLINNNLIFVATEEEKLAAVVCLENIGINGKYLYQIVVDKKYRHQGLGKMIAKFAFSYYENDSNYTSWVEDTNSSSQNLHFQLGFRREDLKTIILKYDRG